jgi:hypothetical protein
MKRERSVTRREYDACYRLMRQGHEFEEIWGAWPNVLPIAKAADYSYQAYGYEWNGWTSDRRRKRFLTRQELPF